MASIEARNTLGGRGPIGTAPPSAAAARVGHIVADHHALRREAAGLLVRAEHGGSLDRTLSDALVEGLSRLCERLREHFALEEEGGYLHEVVAERPELQSRAERLQRQHAILLGEGATLARHLLGAQAPHDTLARLVRLLEALRRHEIAEHDLFQEAFLDDLGGGD